MARARTKTKLSLDRWAEILGIDPRHFNQVTTSAKPPNLCSQVWKQYAWQENDQIGREDVAQAIAQAEEMFESEVKYKLLPDWQVDERAHLTKAGFPDVLSMNSLDARGFPHAIQTLFGHLVSGGIEAKTLIQAGVGVTYTDTDGDSYPETATIIVATTVIDPEQIAVYFPGENGRDEWEIKPLNDPLTRRRAITIAGGVATIIVARELLVDPDLWNALAPEAVDGNVDANFLSTVDIFQHFNDPQQAVTLMWSPRPNLCGCASGSCPTCAHSTQTGCLIINDHRIGSFHFRPATWNATTEEFDAASFAVGRNPDNARLWYYAGFRDMSNDAPNLEMERQLERTIAYLSLTLMRRPVCGCNNIQELFKQMNQDLALNISTSAGSESFQLSDRALLNPWGTKRGALLAWQLAQSGNRKIGQAVAL
ncbi:hypothetical protein LCGC14_0353710 [marine sediment metagenome]|uniref:Uncharacterized protein n=1 Tax=marine sediment metagenome TaxID=412755 RepID=A0A0F9TFS6_9ZZZZ